MVARLNDELGLCCFARIRAMQRHELSRGVVVERAVRRVLVVAAPPGGNDRSRLGNSREPVLVQAFVAKLVVERVDIGFLGGLTWLDELERYAVAAGPLI